MIVEKGDRNTTKSAARRRDLRDDVDAVRVLLHHPLQASDLPLDLPQTPDDRPNGVSSVVDTVVAMRTELWMDRGRATWSVTIPEKRPERVRGLLGHAEPAPGEALFLAGCRSVHTFGMRFTIDALVLDANLAVIRVVTMPPGRILLPRLRVRHVLEVAAGSRVRVGDRFQTRNARSARLKT